jgi:hypothetical protein
MRYFSLASSSIQALQPGAPVCAGMKSMPGRKNAPSTAAYFIYGNYRRSVPSSSPGLSRKRRKAVELGSLLSDAQSLIVDTKILHALCRLSLTRPAALYEHSAAASPARVTQSLSGVGGALF